MNNESHVIYQKKAPWVAVILSLVITGAGQMYCGRVGKGVLLLIGAIVGWMIFEMIGIAVWIYAMIDAYNIAHEINEEFQINISEQNAMKKKEEDKIIEEQMEKDKSIVKIDDFKDNLIKNYKLFQHELITEIDYAARRDEIIGELSYKQINISQEDFLYELILLKENNILSKDDMQKIKSYIL